MDDIKRKFYENYLLGAIKYQGDYNFYLMPIAWWILNYHKYNPNYDATKREEPFRNNVLNVTDSKIDDFVESIDSKRFVSSFPDIEVEDYLPDSSWQGIFGNPVEYLPDELKRVLDTESKGNVSK
jgi:hypothetical protein